MTINGDKGFAAVPTKVWHTIGGPLGLFCLLSYRGDNKTGQSWWSHDAMADDLGVTRSTIKRWLKVLVDAGFVTVDKRVTEAGQTSNLYTVVGVFSGSPDMSHPGSPNVDYEITNNYSLLDCSQVDTNKSNEKKPTLFDEFYRVYPRRVNKARARKAWAAAIKKVPGEYIYDKAREFADDPNREQDERYIPHPSRWLNDEGWENPPCPPKQSGRRRSAAEAEALERGQAELNKLMERMNSEEE